MKSLIIQGWYMITHRAFLVLLLIINVLGTVYGYIWYEGQLVEYRAQVLYFRAR